MPTLTQPPKDYVFTKNKIPVELTVEPEGSPSGNAVSWYKDPLPPLTSMVDFLFMPYARINLLIESYPNLYSLSSVPTPTQNGFKASFDISRIVESLCNPLPVPLFSSFAAHSLNGYILSFSASAHNYFSAIHTFNKQYLAIKGGVNSSLMPTSTEDPSDFFSSFERFFFTWQPYDHCVCTLESPIKLYYLNKEDPAEIRLRYNIFYKDGSSTEHISSTFYTNENTFLEITVLPNTLPDDGNINYFTVELINDSDEAVTHNRKYYVRNLINAQHFWFRNSLGTFDYICLPNLPQQTVEASGNYDEASFFPTEVRVEEYLEVFPAPLLESWRVYFRDLLMSSEIYQVNGNAITRLSLGNNSLPEYKIPDAHLVSFILYNIHSDEYIH